MKTFIDPTIAAGKVERTGLALHRLGDRELSASLIGMLDMEAGGGGWWALVPRSNGDLLHRHNRLAILPDAERQDFARRLVIRLNQELHCNGAWIVGWADANRRWFMFWKDRDGDQHVVVDNDEPWARVRSVPVEHWLDDANAAWAKTFLDFKAVLDLKPGMQAKLAQGESLPRGARD